MSDNPKIHFDLPYPAEGIDLTQMFTSKPYPVVVIEAVTPRARVLRTRLWESTVEAVGPTATITGLNLRPVLQETTVEEEAVGPTATITGLNLETVLLETTIEDEAVGPTATIASLTLNSHLVETTIEDEAVGPTATITGLNLS